MAVENDIAVISKKNPISTAIRNLVRKVADEVGTAHMVDASGAVVLARLKYREQLHGNVRKAMGAVGVVYSDMGGEEGFGPEAYRWDYGPKGVVLAMYAPWVELCSLLGDAAGLLAVKNSGWGTWWGDQQASFPAESAYSQSLRGAVRERAKIEGVKVSVDESGPVYLVPRYGGIVEEDEVHISVNGVAGIAGGIYDLALIRANGGEGSDLKLAVTLGQMVNLVVFLANDLKERGLA